ncbi:MAG TPA: trypsin-like peptidase domain-containing protein [Kofleriaceae bacterium]
MTAPAPASASLSALDNALAAAVKAVGPSVVHVRRGRRDRGGGTGIAWSADLVVTSSFHTPDQTQVGLPNAEGELELRDAEVIGRDPGTDIALLRVKGGGLTPATTRELGELAVGNLALAIGRPGRSARASLRAIGVLGPEVETPYGGTLDRYIESDRQIPRGFAGGPLIDPDGAVIGMNTRTLVRGADLAVPTATLRSVVTELEQHGGIRKGYLGVGAYPSATGALVASVEEGSPAATAGIIVGDIITEVAGDAVDGPDSLRGVLAKRPGEAVTLVVLRGGTRTELSVTLGSKS